MMSAEFDQCWDVSGIYALRCIRARGHERSTLTDQRQWHRAKDDGGIWHRWITAKYVADNRYEQD